MSVTTSVPDGKPPAPEARGNRLLLIVLTVLACAVQTFVLFFTFVMGLGWGGLTYVAALLQATLAFALIARLAARGRSIVVLVPVLSAALTGALAFAGQAHGSATACSERELATAEQLAPPPGTSVELQGNYSEGCLAFTRMRLSTEAIVEHYRAEFARLGWQETPGRHEAAAGIAAVKDGVQIVVDVSSADEDGVQMLEVVVGGGTSASPCLINSVDPYLDRLPVSEVQPGPWTMLASASGERASVVIRDSTATVVFRQQAGRRLDDIDDLIAFEEDSRGTAPLSLREGEYEVECRPGDGAATTVPLRVARTSVTAEHPKDVAVRVSETPDRRR